MVRKFISFETQIASPRFVKRTFRSSTIQQQQGRQSEANLEQKIIIIQQQKSAAYPKR